MARIKAYLTPPRDHTRYTRAIVLRVDVPARALFGLVMYLRNKLERRVVRPEQDALLAEEARVLCEVLVVNAPFHSGYLASVTDKFCTGDLGGEELWTTKELSIPVYNTEDGMEIFSLILVTLLTHVL